MERASQEDDRRARERQIMDEGLWVKHLSCSLCPLFVCKVPLAAKEERRWWYELQGEGGGKRIFQDEDVWQVCMRNENSKILYWPTCHSGLVTAPPLWTTGRRDSQSTSLTNSDTTTPTWWPVRSSGPRPHHLTPASIMTSPTTRWALFNISWDQLTSVLHIYTLVQI